MEINIVLDKLHSKAEVPVFPSVFSQTDILSENKQFMFLLFNSLKPPEEKLHK